MDLDEVYRFLNARGFTLHFLNDYQKHPATFDWVLCAGDAEQPVAWGSDPTRSAMIDHVLRAPELYPEATWLQAWPGFGMAERAADGAQRAAQRQ